jgi:hypothetical protein
MENKKILKFKNALLLFSYILVVWGFYRLFFQLPSWVEEIILKPLLWIGPMLFLMGKKSGLGVLN